MIEIRFHGRGGQGAVVASKMLAVAFFKEGKGVQSFPTYGAERRGAPVAAFIRVDDKPVLYHHNIYAPTHVVVLDPSLMERVDVTQGLKEGGFVLVNTKLKPSDFPDLKGFEVHVVDASGIAVKHGLGSKENPIVNTAVLGAFARASGLVGLPAVLEAVKEESPIKVKANLAAAEEAYDKVK
ncbi:MAG: pyruvate ferredoxin oxidoreductase [Deltaproteobacteria bacterium]|nr:MAG: pyruvate ferredoxin oxidoreductase [Deltaproteobacteria bacterium]